MSYPPGNAFIFHRILQNGENYNIVHFITTKYTMNMINGSFKVRKNQQALKNHGEEYD